MENNVSEFYEKNGVKYPTGCKEVLNHGYVKLVDVMGDDSSIVQAARVSYGKGTKQVNEDRGLIRYLMRHEHTTPFEMVEFKFSCRMPIFIARQWIRHRTASVNEYSGRYSEMPELFFIPELETITGQSKTNKQGGSNEVLSEAEFWQIRIRTEETKAYEDYKKKLESGMRKELARINLPLSQYTEWYWKIDLKNLLHFLKLRLDSHAQLEIRPYGQVMADMVKEIVPMAWEAFEDYMLYSMRLSRLDIIALKNYLVNYTTALPSEEQLGEVFGNKREGQEFINKLGKLI